jgi:PAS domain S-box-containing protein
MASFPVQGVRSWPFLFDGRKPATLILAALLAAVVITADWFIGSHGSLGALYVLPIMLAATFLTRPQLVAAAVLCAFVRMELTPEEGWVDSILAFAMAVVAYTVAGLFVAELTRNQRLERAYLSETKRQQALRREAEEQLRLLVESSPAAILTLDAAGHVLAANRAAHEMLCCTGANALIGEPISEYLPVLADALKLENGDSEFRTAAQCRGRRRSGELFIAHTWFSTYISAAGRRLAAIAVDSSDEMRDREEENLRVLLRSNRILAGAVSHDVRNLCSAIAVIYSNLKQANAFGGSEDFRALGSLVEGLAKVASMELKSQAAESLAPIDLTEVLDQLRIIIEPSWREIGGTLEWEVPGRIAAVLAEPAGLLHAFLNLAQNSHRAVQDCESRILEVGVETSGKTVAVTFSDSGPGVAAPDRLFQPFQSGAESSGIGLYVSRAVLRAFGGDLRHVPQKDGCQFRVELRVADEFRNQASAR